MSTPSSQVGERPNAKEVGKDLPLEKEKLLAAHKQLEKEGERLALRKMFLLGHYKECEELRAEVLSAGEASQVTEKLLAYKQALEKAFAMLESVQASMRQLNGSGIPSKAKGLGALASDARETFEKEEDRRAKELKDKIRLQLDGEAQKDQKIRSKRAPVGPANADKERTVRRTVERRDKEAGVAASIEPDKKPDTSPEGLAQEAMNGAAVTLRFAFGAGVTEAMAEEFNHLTQDIKPEEQAEILNRIVEACRDLSAQMRQSSDGRDWRARALEFGLLVRGKGKNQASDRVDTEEIKSIVTRAIKRQKIFYPKTGNIATFQRNKLDKAKKSKDARDVAEELTQAATGFDFGTEKSIGKKKRAEKEVTIYCKTKLAETVGADVAEIIWEPVLDLVEKQPKLDVLALLKKMHKEMQAYLMTATVRLEGKRSKHDDSVEWRAAVLGLASDGGVDRRSVERLVRRMVEKRKPLFPVNTYLDETELRDALSLDIEERLYRSSGETMYRYNDFNKFPVYFEKGMMVIALRDGKKVSFGPEDTVEDVDARIAAFMPEPKRLSKKEAKESKAHGEVLDIVTGPLKKGLGEDVANALYVAVGEREVDRKKQADLFKNLLEQATAYVDENRVMAVKRNGNEEHDAKEIERRVRLMGLLDADGLLDQEAINIVVSRAMARERIFPLPNDARQSKAYELWLRDFQDGKVTLETIEEKAGDEKLSEFARMSLRQLALDLASGDILIHEPPREKKETALKQELQSMGYDTVRAVVSSVAKEGAKVERKNEDAAISLYDVGLYGVFDGVGGHKGGSEASEFIAKFFTEHAQEISSNYDTPEKTLDDMKRLLSEASRSLYVSTTKDGQSSSLRQDKITTASVVKILPGKEGTGMYRAAVAHVGDSRVYIRYPDGTVETVTEDDASWPAMLDMWAKKDEKIRENLTQLKKDVALSIDSVMSTDSVYISDLMRETLVPFCGTERELVRYIVEFFKERNIISQAVGFKDIAVKGYIRDLPEGSRVVVVSDGISDNIGRNPEHPELDQFAYAIDPSQYGFPGDSSQALISLAQELSRQDKSINIRKKLDDMTAVVVDIGEMLPAKPAVELSPILHDGDEAIEFADDADVTEEVSETVQWYRDLEKAFGPDVLAHVYVSDDERDLVLECDEHEYQIRLVMKDVQDETRTSFFIEMKDGSSLQIMPGYSFDMIRSSIERAAQQRAEMALAVDEINNMQLEAKPAAAQPAKLELTSEAVNIERLDNILPQYLYELIDVETLDKVFDGLTDVSLPVEEKQKLVYEMLDGDHDPKAVSQLMEALRGVGIHTDMKGLVEIWKKEMHQDFFALMMLILDQQRKNEEAAEDREREAAFAKLPLVERIKRGFRDNAFGIGIGLATAPVLTPAGGAAAGLFATRFANLFRRNRKKEKEAVQMQDRIRQNMQEEKHQTMATALKEVFLNRSRMSVERVEGVDETNTEVMAKLNYMRTMKNLAQVAEHYANRSGTVEDKERALEARAAALKAEIDFRNTVKLQGNLKESIGVFTLREKFMAVWSEAVESFKNGKLRELWANDENEAKRLLGHTIAMAGAAGVVQFLALSMPGDILARLTMKADVAFAGGVVRGFSKETRGSGAALSIEVEKLLKRTGRGTEELGPMLQTYIVERLNADTDGQLKERLMNALKTGSIYGALAGVFGGGVEAVRHWHDILDKVKEYLPSGSSGGSRLSPLQEIPRPPQVRDAGSAAGVLARPDGGRLPDAGIRPTSVDAGMDAGGSRPISGSVDGGTPVAAGTDTRGVSLDAGIRDGGSAPDASIARASAPVAGAADGGMRPSTAVRPEYGTPASTTADTVARDGGVTSGGTDIAPIVPRAEADASVAPETVATPTSSASESGTLSMPKEDGSYTLYGAKENTSSLRVENPVGPQSIDLDNGAIELPEISGDDEGEGATDSFFNFFKEVKDPTRAAILQKFVDARAGTVSGDKIVTLIQRRHGITGLTEKDIRRISMWVFQEPVTVVDSTGTTHEVAFIDAKGHTNLGIEKGAGFKIQIDKGNVIMRQVGGEGLYMTDIPPNGESVPTTEETVARTEAPARTAGAPRVASSETAVPEVSAPRASGSARIPEVLPATPKTDFPKTIFVGGGEDYTSTGEFIHILDNKGVDHEAMRYTNGREQVILTNDGVIYDGDSSDRMGHVDLAAEADDMIYEEDDTEGKVDLASEYTVSAPRTTEKLDKINVITTMEKGHLAVNHIEVKSPISKEQAVKMVFGTEVDKDVERVMKTASSSLREKVQNLALLNDAYRTLRKDGEGDSEMARALHNKIVAEMKLLPKVLGYPEKTPEDIFDRSILEDHGLDITASGEYWNDLEVVVERNYSGSDRQTLLNYLKLLETRGKIYTNPKLMEKLLMTARIPEYEIHDVRTEATVQRLVGEYRDASQALELHIKSGKSLEFIRKQLLPFSFEFDRVIDRDLTKLPESTLTQAVIRSDATTLGENTKVVGSLRMQLAEDAKRPRVEVKAPTADQAKDVGDRIEKKMKGRGLSPKMDVKGGKDKT